jgi:hypothetical protein
MNRCHDVYFSFFQHLVPHLLVALAVFISLIFFCWNNIFFLTGKERLFLEVARVLRKKVYVNAAKLRILRCLGLPEEDMQWFTLNEQESHIHVVPMWTLASFKRLKHISNQYAVRYTRIIHISISIILTVEWKFWLSLSLKSLDYLWLISLGYQLGKLTIIRDSLFLKLLTLFFWSDG